MCMLKYLKENFTPTSPYPLFEITSLQKKNQNITAKEKIEQIEP